MNEILNFFLAAYLGLVALACFLLILVFSLALVPCLIFLAEKIVQFFKLRQLAKRFSKSIQVFAWSFVFGLAACMLYAFGRSIVLLFL